MPTICLAYTPSPADPTGCVALWRAVIYRALCDACFDFFDEYMLLKHSFKRAGPQYITAETWRHAQDARRFLLGDGSGFNSICVRADIDPGYLRRRARRAVDEVDLMVKIVPPLAMAKPYRTQRLGA